jgi:hypothetical protein
MKNRKIGKNSPNLVTLAAADDTDSGFFPCQGFQFLSSETNGWLAFSSYLGRKEITFTEKLLTLLKLRTCTYLCT